jgi:hypothetical protein
MALTPYGFDDVLRNIWNIRWDIEISDEFEPEFDGLHEDVRTEIWHRRCFLKFRDRIRNYGSQSNVFLISTVALNAVVKKHLKGRKVRLVVSGQVASQAGNRERARKMRFLRTVC